MLWILAFHVISMVAWFAGLFYLPRLFVYHADIEPSDVASNARFNTMEHRLYHYIMNPAAALTTIFGVWLLSYNFDGYLQAHWMQLKLLMVLLLWAYHCYCGYFLRLFAQSKRIYTAKFFRFFNEVPTLLLIVIVIAVIVKPW